MDGNHGRNVDRDLVSLRQQKPEARQFRPWIETQRVAARRTREPAAAPQRACARQARRRDELIAVQGGSPRQYLEEINND